MFYHSLRGLKVPFYMQYLTPFRVLTESLTQCLVGYINKTIYLSPTSHSLINNVFPKDKIGVTLQIIKVY